MRLAWPAEQIQAGPVQAQMASVWSAWLAWAGAAHSGEEVKSNAALHMAGMFRRIRGERYIERTRMSWPELNGPSLSSEFVPSALRNGAV